MGYNIPVLNLLSDHYNAEVIVVSWRKRLREYVIEGSENIKFHFKETFSKKELENFVMEINPTLVVVVGWMDKDYLKICKKLKREKKSIIVAGSDTPWSYSFRHWIATLIAPFFHKRIFDYLWVSGPWQYEYGRRLGFSNDKIIFNWYSANIEMMKNNVMHFNMKERSLLFLGRFDKVKGIDLLLNAFSEYKNETKSKLKLKLIGGGAEWQFVKTFESESIKIKDFVQPKFLIEELNDIQGFILPSIQEPWGLVIQEMAAAGLPLLTSNICGANSFFALNNFNAFIFKAGSKEEIKKVLNKFDSLSSEQLNLMGVRSRQLSERITPEISAASLMSVFNKI